MKQQTKCTNLLHSVDYHLGKNHDAYKLLTGEDNNTDYGRVIAFHEFLDPRYFSRDMFNFLEQIKVKIDNTD